MAKEFLSPLLLCLLVLMAMVGFVELGTDSWIANITGNLLADPKKGLYLFIWTSSLMFALRFFAGPIVDRISPLGLLFGAALFGAAGLFLLSQAGAEFSLGGAVAAAAIAALDLRHSARRSIGRRCWASPPSGSRGAGRW